LVFIIGNLVKPTGGKTHTSSSRWIKGEGENRKGPDQVGIDSFPVKM